MSGTTLKPCPFCGAQASYSLEEDESQQNAYDTVSCSGCGAQVRALLHWAENGGEHAATLTAAWNTRTHDSDPRDEVIKRLTAELANGSFYKESDIDRLMAERDVARAEVTRLREAIKLKGGTEHSPTEDAYNAACVAIAKHKTRADAAESVVARLAEALQYAEWAGDRIADCITANIDRQHEKIADAISLGKEVSARARGALQEQLK